MPISEIFEEKKIQVLQANKIGLWDVLEELRETRKFRHHIKKPKGK
jgi:hypothetical protein